VAEAIEYEQFDQDPSSAGASPGTATPDAALGANASDPDLSRLSDIPMELSVEIGRTHMTVGETLGFCFGSVVSPDPQAGEAADLLVNGTAIARGEVIVMDERYGLRVTEILESNQISASSGTAGAVADEPVAANS
jgi:flagellar motor switch protein FliN